MRLQRTQEKSLKEQKMKKMKILKGIVAGATIIFTAGFAFTGCQSALDENGEETGVTASAARSVAKPAEDWEQFTDGEIEKAKKECPPAEKKKVQAFEGAAAKLFNIGANLVMEDIEDDQLYMFAGYGKKIIGAGMKYLDGFLDSYTGGFYKAAVGLIFPQEQTIDPEIEKIQKSIEELQDGVATIIADIGRLSEKVDIKFDTRKIIDRLNDITEQKSEYVDLFALLSQFDASSDMNYKTFYEIEQNAQKHFASIENMKSKAMKFFEAYYTGNVAGETYGQAYRLIGESMYPWRYQSNEFIQQMMAIELAPATKMFTICDILMNPVNENVQKSLQLEFIAKHYTGKGDIEIKYIEALHAGDQKTVDEIEAEMAKVAEIKEYKETVNAAKEAWSQLVNNFSTYAYTINNIEIPGEDSSTSVTCNVRCVRYTFSQNAGFADYAFELKKLAGASSDKKTKANWKKIYITGGFGGDNGTGEMLSLKQYQDLLNFYKGNNMKPNNGKIKTVKGSNGKWYMKKTAGDKVAVNLYNIFRFDAGVNLMMNRNNYTDCSNDGTEYPMLACLNNKNEMGFEVSDEKKGDWNRWDGRHYWKVKATIVESGEDSVSEKTEMILDAMTARAGVPEKIASLKYYNNSYVSKKLIAAIDIVKNNDVTYNK